VIGENLISEIYSLRCLTVSRTSRVSEFSTQTVPFKNPIAISLPSGEYSQARPAFSNNLPLIRPRFPGSMSQMRSVWSSLKVQHSRRLGWVARPQSSPAPWPCITIPMVPSLSMSIISPLEVPTRIFLEARQMARIAGLSLRRIPLDP